MYYLICKVDNSKRRFLIETLIWIGIYFGIAFIISRLVPFPYSLIAIIIAVMGLGFYRRRRYFRRTGQAESSGSSYFGSMFGSQKNVNYYCLNCGTKHDQTSCPNCGSKLKKAGFWWRIAVLKEREQKRWLMVLLVCCWYLNDFALNSWRQVNRFC
jgi:hypothetical protein